MPSSDLIMIPKVLEVIARIMPQTILDVGIGNGRYGFLFRECFDWNHGRLGKDNWEVTIDGVEIDRAYISPVQRYCYNDIVIADWMDYTPLRAYDVIFMGDVLEHWIEDEWQKALSKARKYSNFTIVVSPNWEGSIAQGAWYGHEQETHRVVLNPAKVGGRCLFASSKMFMCAFDNEDSGLLDGRKVCL